MKSSGPFVIILSVHTASTFPQRDRWNDFTRELTDSYIIFMNVSDYKDAGCRLFNKACVIQWKTIRAKISEKDPSVSLDP